MGSYYDDLGVISRHYATGVYTCRLLVACMGFACTGFVGDLRVVNFHGEVHCFIQATFVGM